ncbi:MAG: PH domain-containing protein, partial [Planctomycetaceae bacterium]
MPSTQSIAAAQVQPIAGVTTGGENEIMSVFPSIGATAPGRWLGSLFESIPLGACPVKLSHLLFVLPMAPFAAVIYVWLKIWGQRLMLTNRALVVRSALGRKEFTRVNLTDIGDVTCRRFPGQQFFRCGNLALVGNDGKLIRTLPAVPHAD